jgi:hypothetical protein
VNSKLTGQVKVHAAAKRKAAQGVLASGNAGLFSSLGTLTTGEMIGLIVIAAIILWLVIEA